MSDRVYNFSAGPAVLPESVIKKVQQSVWSLGDSGIGIMEHSHRSAEFSDIIEKADATCRAIVGVPENHSVLFLQGGASTQFYMIPMNYLTKDQSADYINTGAWSKKAMKEARLFGGVHEAASGEDENFSYIPPGDSIKYSDSPAYVHFTSNNTIFGTQWQSEPTVPAGTRLFCDASSDIMSRPLDISKYGIVYAGAQKNLGPAGLCLVIIDNDLAETGPTDLPTMLQYRTHIKGGSRFNTPPAFGIYVVGEVFQWIQDFGGLSAIAEYNRAKAKLIYDLIDSSEFYRSTVRPDSRSNMNICFRGPSDELEAKFIKEASDKGLVNLKGHRSVGGMRASIYNAFPEEGCVKLVEFMKAFELANT